MKRSIAWLAEMVVCVVVAGSGWADTVVTTNAGAWDGPVWTPHAPNAGDVAVLKHNLTLSNATVALAACTNTAGATLTFSTTNAVLNATAVWVDGKLTHNVESATTTNALGQWIKDNWVSIVCSNLTISTTGSIDVSAVGYLGRVTTNDATGVVQAGCGPGAGAGSIGSGGGGYGGMGGAASGGATYGSMTSPSDPGSGGGSYLNGTGQAFCWGGNGGGLVQIAASNVTVNGSILANGGNSGSSVGGGGSGGGIWIACSTLAGSNGVIAANGGTAKGSTAWGIFGGGGGGRVSIQYDPVAQSNLTVKPTLMTISARAGGIGPTPGRPGTVSMVDNTVLTAGFFQGGQVFGFNTWTMPSLNLSSNDAVAVFTNGFRLTVGNDLLCSGARSGIEMSNGVLNVGGSLVITNGGNGLFYNCAVTISSNLGLGFGTFTTFAVDPSVTMLSIGGNLIANSDVLYSYCSPTNIFTNSIAGNIVLTNSTKWYVYSAMTNSGTPYYGALVSAGGDVVLSTNCWIYPYSNGTNGGSPTFRAKNLTIATNAGFDATGGGYTNNLTTGYGNGPGGGRGLSNSGSGGGYGGAGGRSTDYVGGTNYGSAMYPSFPGSAGGVYSKDYVGGYGGGLVRIEVPQGRVTVSGTIRVDGNTGNATVGGGGAGGGIYILCRRFAGLNGLLSAKGGNAPGTWNSRYNGGGGGGRIAVWRMIDESSGISSNISGGTTSNSLPSGQVGTFYWGSIPSQGLLFLVR